MPEKPENSRIRKWQSHQRCDEKKKQKMESEDHMSGLPDNIIHYILSFLRCAKEVARTSVLSKRWRELWYSFSSLTFDQRTFAGRNYLDKEFLEYVDKSLRLHLEKNKDLKKLSIHMVSFDARVIIYLDHWLDLVSERNIIELDINIDKKTNKYLLPEHVFSTESLSRLRLCGCTLTGFNNIRLPYLQKLCLRKVKLDEQIIQNLISNCKLIDDLRLIQCSGLKGLQTYNCIKLNRVEIHQCYELRKVELDCPNLHTFWFHSEKSTPCEVNLPSCKSLKRLRLGYHQVNVDFCEKTDFYDFPLLETLALSTLDNLKCIVISNPQLQRLALKGCKEMDFVSINAPKLRSFEFQGQKMPHINMYPCSLRDAKLSFEPIDKSRPIIFDKQEYFPKLMDFIKEFDDSKGGYNVVVRSKKNIVIYENLDQVLLPELPNLSIDIISSLVFSDHLDSFLCTCHPKTLCMIFPSNRGFPKLVYKRMKNKEVSSSCCRYSTSSNKCWRHFLEDIKIEDFGDVNNRWTYNWLHWLKSTQTALPHHLTTFALYWKPFKRDDET